MSNDRRNQLLDLVLKYNQQLRAETKDMTNEERVYFLDSHIKAVSAAMERFEQAMKADAGG